MGAGAGVRGGIRGRGAILVLVYPFIHLAIPRYPNASITMLHKPGTTTLHKPGTTMLHKPGTTILHTSITMLHKPGTTTLHKSCH